MKNEKRMFVSTINIQTMIQLGALQTVNDFIAAIKWNYLQVLGSFAGISGCVESDTGGR